MLTKQRIAVSTYLLNAKWRIQRFDTLLLPVIAAQARITVLTDSSGS